MSSSAREKELELLVRSFVLDMVDYMIKNDLGDPEKMHNIKWARKLGILDTLERAA
jgi:hypothetical protein